MNGDQAREARIPPKKGFLRNLFLLAGGTALGQAFAVACTPILTRIYAPADFAAFGVFTAALLILNTMDSCRYEMAIPLPDADQTADDLLALCCGLVIVSGLITGVVCLLWGGAFSRMAKVPGLARYLWLLPLSLVAAGLAEALTYFSIRRKAFHRMAQSRLGQGAGQSATQLGLGAGSLGSFGLLAGDTVGRFMGVALLARGGWFRTWWSRISWSGMKAAAKAYIRFPMFMSWATLLNITALQVPFLLIPVFFGADLAGNYFLAYRILVLPTGLVGGAVAQIFLGEASAVAQDPEKLRSLASRLFLALLAAYLPLYLFLAVEGSACFQLLFGPRWLHAGAYMQILAPMALFWGIASPLSSVLVVRDRLKESLLFTVVELAFKLVAIIVGVHFHSLLLTVVLVASMASGLSMLASWRFLRASHADFVELARRALPLVAMSPLLIVSLLVAVLCFTPLFALLIGLALLIGAYFWTLKTARRGGAV